ncbi:hypothetical protein ACGFIF_34605 [Kribbella sp. NPDC049174]|uniref:hypothetical protein n=1 Tax=Kribbella sp. NPDC049174 TaxID=3364112 RepID=UPI00371FDBC2
MSPRTALVELLGRYDDDAWAALATKGLLRRARKDLTQLTPSIVAEGPESVEVAVGEVTVTFGPAGPAVATCTCASGSTCQHVVAAGIWLGLGGGAEAASGGAGPTSSPAVVAGDMAGLGAELLGVGRAELVEFAGSAGYRWARGYVEDLELEEGFRVEGGQQLVLSLVSPRVSFRSMGGGLAGMVPDSKLPAVEKYQVAAVLAYQRANGKELEPIRRREPSTVGATVGDGRVAVRMAVVQLLTDTVRLGLSHLSDSILQRYETLAVSAQGAEYHRLARALRAMAGQVELALARSARADERFLLEQAATTYALVSALESMGDVPRLVGTARGRFDTAGKLELIGVGSVPWRSASGFAGLTAVFWAAADDRFVAWTDSRSQGVLFDPRNRYDAPGPWSGMHSPAEATGSSVKLANARLTSTGQLSGVDSTRALVVRQSGAEIAAALPAVSRWAGLAGRPVSLLDPADPLREWAILRPAGFGPASFDQAMQRLEWPVTDEAGDVLPLHLPYSAETQHAVARIEALPTPAPGTLVVAKIRRTAEGVVGEPLSLVHPDAPAGSAVDALHFGPEPVARPRPMTGPRASSTAAPPPQLLDLANWLVRQAERGTAGTSPGAFTAELTRHRQALSSVGFTVVPATTESPDPAAVLLRSLYLTLQITQLLTGATA